MLFPCTDQQFRELHIDLFLKSGWIICEQIHEKGSGHTEPSSSPISSPLYELKELGTSILMHYSCLLKTITSTTHNPSEDFKLHWGNSSKNLQQRVVHMERNRYLSYLKTTELLIPKCSQLIKGGEKRKSDSPPEHTWIPSNHNTTPLTHCPIFREAIQNSHELSCSGQGKKGIQQK